MAIDATTPVVQRNKKELIAQLVAATKLVRDEISNATGEARENARRVLLEMRAFRESRDLDPDTELTKDQAKALLKAVNETRKLVEGLKAANPVAGADGKTLTERSIEARQELATQESVVSILKEINEERQSQVEAKKNEYRTIKDTFRSTFTAFLGPVGPLVQSVHDLRTEYGDDIKKLGGKVRSWLGVDKDVLREYERESQRSSRRDSKLFSMLNVKLRKLGNAIENGGGSLLDKLLNFVGLGRKRGPTGGGKGGKAGKGGRLGKIGAGIGRFGRGLLKFGSRLLGPLGVALGISSLAGDVDAGERDEDGLDTGLSYGGGALTGATIGALGGPIGAAIGAVVGLAITGVVRNWSAFKKRMTDAWDGTVELAKTAWSKLGSFGEGLKAFVGSTWHSIKTGYKHVSDWLTSNVPGFSALSAMAGKVKSKGAGAIESVQSAVSSAVSKVTGGDKPTDAATNETGPNSSLVDQIRTQGMTLVKGATSGVKALAASLGTTEQGEALVKGSMPNLSAMTPESVGKLASTGESLVRGLVPGTGSAPQTAKSVVPESAKGLTKMSDKMDGRARLEKAMTDAGITDPKERAMFLAQADQESGLTNKSENLNYRSVSRIREVFGKNKGIQAMSDDEVQRLVNNPEGLANVVYADKNRGSKNKLGNTEDGDGYKYRARSPIGLTGKDNYARYGKLLGVDLVNNPDLANDPDIGTKIAIAYWKQNKIGEHARRGDVSTVTQLINGGDHGLKDRFAKYKAYLDESNGSAASAVQTAGTSDSSQYASTSPVAGEYERVASQSAGANVRVAQPDGESSGAQLVAFGNNQQVRAVDIPMVLGENHMVVLNAGMLGA